MMAINKTTAVSKVTLDGEELQLATSDTKTKYHSVRTNGLFFSHYYRNGSFAAYGDCFWTDGEDLYYSRGTTQKVFDKTTNEWVDKTWNGSYGTQIYGNYMWTDGKDIYCSRGSKHYLYEGGLGWSLVTFTGLSSFYGNAVWSNGENIYMSNYSLEGGQYVLTKGSRNWELKNWSVQNVQGLMTAGIWTDGQDIYCSFYDVGEGVDINARLDKKTNTWVSIPYENVGFDTSSLGTISGKNVWSDGENIYYSNSNKTLKWNKETKSFEPITLYYNGFDEFDPTVFSGDGEYIWSDGEKIYYDYSNYHYVLYKNTLPNLTKIN